MGVEFYGYTHVKRVEIPPEYRHTKVTHSIPKDEYLRKLREYPADDCLSLEDVISLRMMFHNERMTLEGMIERTEYSKPDTPEYNEWYNSLMKDDNLVHTDFDNHCYYLKTPETTKTSIGRSYSGYHDWIEKIQKIYPLRVKISPYGGAFLTNTQKRIALNDLQEIREEILKQFQEKTLDSKDWGTQNDEGEYHLTESLETYWDFEFLQGMIQCLEYASQDGFFVAY
jgi:hypothetical protein